VLPVKKPEQLNCFEKYFGDNNATVAWTRKIKINLIIREFSRCLGGTRYQFFSATTEKPGNVSDPTYTVFAAFLFFRFFFSGSKSSCLFTECHIFLVKIYLIFRRQDTGGFEYYHYADHVIMPYFEGDPTCEKLKNCLKFGDFSKFRPIVLARVSPFVVFLCAKQNGPGTR
jgi:hypothetical protein